jgi:hypothetical protein
VRLPADQEALPRGPGRAAESGTPTTTGARDTAVRPRNRDTLRGVAAAGQAAGERPQARRPQFYQQRGLQNVELLGERTEKVENSSASTRRTALLTEPRPFNLMFKTYVGPVESEDNVAYLRPGDGAGDLRAVQERARNLAPERCRSASPRSARRSATRSRRATSPSARASSSRWNWSSSSSPTRRSKPSTARWPPCRKASRRAAAQLGLAGWHQYWVEERIRFYEGIGLPRTTLGVLAEARGTRALRPRLRGHPVQVPVRHAGTRRHRRPQRFRSEPAPAVLRQGR